MNYEETIERMHSGRLYFCDNERLIKEQMAYAEKLFQYNQLSPAQQSEKNELLKEMFAEIGEGCYIESPLRANWGGRNVHFGKNIYANFNLVLVDDTGIYVGDNVMFGPNVTLCAATHPISPELRIKQVQYNLPVHIGKNAWIGSNSVILPGVTVGENSVIGAGSIVNKDIPANVVAVGNPCRVLREINDNDRKYYFKNREIDL
ncbi:MAG: sugar O-acetyltransferase [Eubacteriales bacterium]|nr:sugar O-acetyltransferase [Eubacteriales bacterium]